MTALPGVLGEIADVAGETAALAIAEARGGTEVYIPPYPEADHWLSQLVGLDAALAISDRLTCHRGLMIELPLGPAGSAARLRAKVDQMIREGRSERDIALTTRYTIRGIRRRRALLGLQADDRQLSLL